MNPSIYQIMEYRWKLLLCGLVKTCFHVKNKELFFTDPEDYNIFFVSRRRMIRDLYLMKMKLHQIRPQPTVPYSNSKENLDELGMLVDDIIDECKEKFDINTDYYTKYMESEIKDNLFPLLYKSVDF